ncbi:MAG: biotin synthase BioB [Desulfuromonadales bacterium C00003068]|jgi:biotin synthase|nr:MAG: biotin synthase BioB [Desulfuromonadales bacterium C00003068]
MNSGIHQRTEAVLAGDSLTAEQALSLISKVKKNGSALDALHQGAEAIRRQFCGEQVELCAIVNAKSGRCAENCAFCAQSQHHQTATPIYPLRQPDQLLKAAKRAEQGGARCFSLVTSGTRVLPGEEIDTLLRVIEQIATQCDLDPSVSLGFLDPQTAMRLVDAGCVTYHHNLETARSFFTNVCTTHDYHHAIDTVTVAQRAGLRVCSGGIFGMGESWAQRIELACTLRELKIDSVPINFLTPVAGTPLENQPALAADDCLTTVSLFRYLLPQARISVCGGRQYQLKTRQNEIFKAGASGMMIGDFLTTSGSALSLDHQLLQQAGMAW